MSMVRLEVLWVDAPCEDPTQSACRVWMPRVQPLAPVHPRSRRAGRGPASLEVTDAPPQRRPSRLPGPHLWGLPLCPGAMPGPV